jgi:TatD DNase family protein
MFVDIHTHNRISNKGVCIYNLTLAEAEESVESSTEGYFSVGLHPWDSEKYTDDLFATIEKLSTNKNILAIGECGLDKNTKTPFEKQLAIFKKQVVLSELIRKPLIIHCVGYYNELLDLMKKMNPEQLWIVHGFRGKPELAKQLLNAGCALSYGEHFNAASVRITPFKKLFIETDESLLPITELYCKIAAAKQCRTNELIAGGTFIENLPS